MSSRLKRSLSHPPWLQGLSLLRTQPAHKGSGPAVGEKGLAETAGQRNFCGLDICAQIRTRVSLESGFQAPSRPHHPTHSKFRLEGLGDFKYLSGSVMKMLINITRDLSLQCEILWYQQGVFKHNWQQEAYGQRFKLQLFFFLLLSAKDNIFFSLLQNKHCAGMCLSKWLGFYYISCSFLNNFQPWAGLVSNRRPPTIAKSH